MTGDRTVGYGPVPPGHGARRRALWLALGLAPLVAGCQGLAIEKKTLVLVVPPESKRVWVYSVLEGLSVTGDNLPRAVEDLKRLREPGLSFFPEVELYPAEKPFPERYFEYDELRFFLD